MYSVVPLGKAHNLYVQSGAVARYYRDTQFKRWEKLLHGKATLVPERGEDPGTCSTYFCKDAIWFKV